MEKHALSEAGPRGVRFCVPGFLSSITQPGIR